MRVFANCPADSFDAQNKQKFDTPQHIFIPDEPYNPAKPNDLQEWREFRKTRREERRREREERARREGSEKSWYSEDEDWSEEEVVRRDGEWVLLSSFQNGF